MDISRRQFLSVSATTGVMVMTVSLPGSVLAQNANKTTEESIWSHYLKIYPDNRIEIGSPVMDMGQHMKTTGPMMIAEELDADWSLVSCIPAKTYLKRVGDRVDHKYAEESSGGSHATRNTMPYLRKAGATARQMLRQAAAEKWRCNLKDVTTKAGYLYQTSTSNKLSYGQVASIAASLPVPKAEPQLKDISEFKIIGTDITTVDIDQITTGMPLFGQDMEMEGMLHASIERSPHFEGRVKSFDATDALAVSGVVKVFKIDEIRTADGKIAITSDGVVIVAKSLWAAMKGRRALKVVWDKGVWKDENSDSMYADYRNMVRGGKDGKVSFESGDIKTAFKSAVKVFDQEYENPFFAHACMEPFNAIADIRAESGKIISGHQNPAGIANAVAETVKLDPMSIEVVSPRSGGGFGRRYATDFVREAAIISQKLAHPVKVTWTREDEISQDLFAQAIVSRIRAGIDKNGKLVAWHLKEGKKEGGIWAQCFPAHLIDNYRAEAYTKSAGIPLGPWRGPGHLQFAFAAESMIDEVATSLERDPLEYRLDLMGEHREFDYKGYGADKINSGRMALCYKAAAKLANWQDKRPEGVGLGIAGHFTFGSYAAFVVEVDTREQKPFRITNAWGAIDCGLAVNPNHIRNQMEGGFIDGLNAAMYNDIKVEQGKVVNTNFHTLQWMKMSQAPRSIETAILKNDYKPTGVGEPPTAPAAAALANAIYAATGKRLRKLPLTLEV